MKTHNNYRGVYCFIMLMVSGLSFSQVGIFIAEGDSVYITQNDSVGFFSNVFSRGIVESEQGSNVIFLSEYWENDTVARFPGLGKFTFQQPSSLGSDVNQKLGGKIWENRFPSMVIKNPNDVNLFGVAGVRDTFAFDTGCIVHDKNDFIVGDGNAGVILSYDENKYFVTNNTHQSDSGFLVRESVSTVDIDFPVGNAKNDYTPARISNEGDVDAFFVRVFPNVYEFGNSGNVVPSITVNRTWNILENTAGGSEVNLTLQHNAATEGGAYDRSDQYVARYFGSTNHAYLDESSTFWDYAASGNGYGNTAGDIHSSGNYGFMATRSQKIETEFSKTSPTRYFTKASTVNPILVELLYLEVCWINEYDSEIRWATASELNSEEFIVYRSYDMLTFDSVATVKSKAPGGRSSSTIEYTYLDDEISRVQDVVYYVLYQKDFNGTRTRYGPEVLKRIKGPFTLVASVYPNPSRNQATLSLVGERKGVLSYEIINGLGQLVEVGELEKRSFSVDVPLGLEKFSSGIYWLRIRSNTNAVIKPVQIIITR